MMANVTNNGSRSNKGFYALNKNPCDIVIFY
jgi:hypothetical protein